MKSLLQLHLGVVQDMYDFFGLDAQKDVMTITSRVENEGDRFLTVVLPDYFTHILHAVESGSLNPEIYRVSKRKSPSDARPRFLWDLVRLVLGPTGTVELTADSAFALAALGQICNLVKKVASLPSDEVLAQSVERYVSTDHGISDSATYDDEDLQLFRKSSLVLWQDIDFFTRGLIKPRHGPGSVAERLPSNQKFTNRVWTERLETEFPSSDFVIPSYRYWEELNSSELVPPGQEPPARVVPVPKTATKARIICIEPVHMQYVQQGLFSRLTSMLNLNPVCSYSSQLPNQQLAREGSISGNFSTIDLSDASDRVSLTLVKHMLWFTPQLLSKILACRSQRAILPNGEIILLKKFASMGSALTFPIESMVFTTIIFGEWCRLYDLPVTRSSFTAMVGKVRVFGDDIIVPTPLAHPVIQALERFGLRVNHDKTFLNSAFRESCGAEWFGGVDVAQVKLRRLLPVSREHVDETVALVAFRNLYCEKYGKTKLVTALDEFLTGLLGSFPAGRSTTGALVRYGLWDPIEPSGSHKRLQCPTIDACTVTYRYREDVIDGTDALLKYFVSPFQEDPKHLMRAGRPVGSRITYRKGIAI